MIIRKEENLICPSADHGTKIEVIEKNPQIYSVSAMCEVLKIARSTFYYESETLVQKGKEIVTKDQKSKDKHY